MTLTEKQERALCVLDDLIDEGIDVTNLRQEIHLSNTYSYDAVRTRLRRAFGSVENALRAYGLYDQTAEPERLELERCFYIDQDYRVSENRYKSEELKELYGISEIKFQQYKKGLLENLEREALDIYVRDTFPYGLKRDYIYKHKLWHVEKYLRNFYGHSVRKLCEEWDFSYELFNDSYSSFYITQGHKFEDLVGEVLDAIYPGRVESQRRIENCIPDFIVNGTHWIDAKLSEKTAFNRASKTFSKYLKHTEDLTIIYAQKSDGVYSFPNVTLVHISRYIPELIKIHRSDLVEKINAFLSNLKITIENVS
ncbi:MULTISPECIES: hypothetical protein [Bacillus]|uniref:hypothetical protein n=1 Tax=Bacillus TaxID=1386 RepID=UPI0009B7BD4D|nr:MULTISPECIES: hypothetical protein [Bacillus]ARC72383.1 hypothetical protein B37_00328 [Bacillus licheniformis]ARW41519.1 hypothetical protein S100141_00194 [Bacillus licheniformis]ARW46012.1 hypothetical protein S100141_04792 [Bacillus licheniformis]ARW52993.1 hypothetical protein S100027_00994 [Bacillus licheniformis]AXF87658.1 hypothetical protein BLDA23_04945 [Bacillus licheniformis]